MFIDREKELEAFRNLGKLNIVFGRRRVGKTAFVKELLKQKIKDGRAIYLLAINRNLRTNLARFSQNISEFFGIPGLNFRSFREMFMFLEKQPIETIAIDEFGYLIKHGILPEFQEIIDEILQTKHLILTGSSISIMEQSFLDYGSPLYGRADKILHLKPLGIEHLFEWFRDCPLNKLVKIYAVTNGVPKYLNFFNCEQKVEDQIVEQFFRPNFLFYDARKLLGEELKEPARYFSILEAIANGKNTLNEIRNFTHVEYESLPYYLQRLRRLRIIRRELPLFGKRKKALYELADLYFYFWFAFVYPFEDEIDSDLFLNAESHFSANFNTYLGRAFERVIQRLFQQGLLVSGLKRAGRWWWKDKEIDLLGLPTKTTEPILLGEVKWQDKVNPKTIAKDLLEKAEYLPSEIRDKPKRILLVAKSFARRISELDGVPVKCVDLKGIERMLKQNLLMEKQS